jgi:hypothetical protein
MKHEAMRQTDGSGACLVTARKLLELIWPDEECRPCVRSVRSWTASRILPSVRVGGLIFYDVEAVRAALAKRTVKAQ